MYLKLCENKVHVNGETYLADTVITISLIPFVYISKVNVSAISYLPLSICC